ncbi:class I SAM-dependent methyltransferase [Saccharobesus litoralis]|uniref:class I SAM-dependent methyltransferase n=1 Tax=Saccharobesus litoralis TaxID=2172099 RepID=UPI00131F163F|nr:methyltransferase [Saccharobesus litoralis]
MKITLSIISLFAVLTCTGCSLTHAENSNSEKEKIKAAISAQLNASHRSIKNQARDKYRHPAETLAFLGVKPNSHVVEIWPGAGWYSEILAPYLKEQGQFYAAHFPANSGVKYFDKHLANFKQKLASNPIYSKTQLTEFHIDKAYAIAPAGSADVVLTFRNLHNWYMNNQEAGMRQAFDSFYKALKPGGILGIVDHQLPEDRDQEQWLKSGYLKKSLAIEIAEQAGFKLVGDSNINLNPLDDADHANGVWSLLPVHRGKDPKLLNVGESTRFTLKFIKPNQ